MEASLHVTNVTRIYYYFEIYCAFVFLFPTRRKSGGEGRTLPYISSFFSTVKSKLKTCLYFVPLFFSARQIAAGLAVTEFNAAAFEMASQFDTTNFTSDTTRQLSKVGKKSLSDDEMKNLSSIISQMGQIYGEVSMYLPLLFCTHSFLIFFILFVHLNYPILMLCHCSFATISITVCILLYYLILCETKLKVNVAYFFTTSRSTLIRNTLRTKKVVEKLKVVVCHDVT